MIMIIIVITIVIMQDKLLQNGCLAPVRKMHRERQSEHRMGPNAPKHCRNDHFQLGSFLIGFVSNWAQV